MPPDQASPWLLAPLLVLLGVLSFPVGGIESVDSGGSVCFNDCSGHGHCVDFSCECFLGYFGDDCRYSFADDGRDGPVIPILGAGHFNISSRKKFRTVTRSPRLMLVGFSSQSCHKCIMFERDYMEASEHLRDLSVPFGRSNAAKFPEEVQEAGVTDLPALVFYRKGKAPLLYVGSQDAHSVVSFARKLLMPTVSPLRSVDDAIEFLQHRAGHLGSEDQGVAAVHPPVGMPAEEVPWRTLQRPGDSISVLGFFRDPHGIEDEEYMDFIEAVEPLKDRVASLPLTT